MDAFRPQDIDRACHRSGTGRNEYGELSVRVFLDDERRDKGFLDFDQCGLEEILRLISGELAGHAANECESGNATKYVLRDPMTDALTRPGACDQTDDKAD